MTKPHPDSRTLFPRRVWPWPDLEARIAEAADWAEAGADLHGPLRLLTLPVIRRTNLGFVSALVSRGVPVPPDIVVKARTVLHRLVDGDATTPAWRRYAGWFAEIDHAFATAVLRDLVLKPEKPVPERYQVWAFLYETSLEDAVRVAEDFASDAKVPPDTRVLIGDKLAEFDLDTALAVFGQVATRARYGDVRNQATEFIERHAPARAVELFAGTAANPAVDEVERLKASRRVLAHDRDRGIDLHFGLVTTATGTTVRTEAMNDLRSEVPKRLATRLDTLRSTDTPAARRDFTRYLVDHFGRGPEIVVDLATDPALPPEDQLPALKIHPGAATPELVTDIVKRFPKHVPAKVDAITLLAKLSPDSAFALLQDIVADRDLAFPTRMTAVAQPAPRLGPQRTIDLYRILTTDGVATYDQRNAAASAATTLDVTKGRKLYEELARNRDLPVDDRLRFTQKTGRARSLELLREFAREVGPTQVKAALEAASRGADTDRAYLRQLAASPTQSYSDRKPLIAKLPRADRITVLDTIAGSPVEAVDAKVDAAIALGRLDKDLAVARLDALEAHPKTPNSIKNKARNAARQLR